MDKEVYKQVFDCHFDALRNYLFYRCGDPELATDIAQETFLKLWEKRLDIDPVNIKGLLYKMASDIFVSWYRRQQTALKFANQNQTEENERSPQEELEYNEFKESYENAINALPENQRVVYLMNRYDEMTYKEIAEALKISVKAVEKRMTKALGTLKQILKL